MKIAVLGTGYVGRVLAARLDGLGHDVTIGTRGPKETVARTGADSMGTPPFSSWQAEHDDVELRTFADAVADAELILNATHGAVSLDVLHTVGANALAGKVLLDLALPLDFSQGRPPMLTIANDDSLGEQIQRSFPSTRVVKSLNSVFCEVMVEPSRLPGAHSIFIAGDDTEAKQLVEGILIEFGWSRESIIDLGDITGARGAEMYSRLFFTLAEVFGSYELNINVVRAQH